MSEDVPSGFRRCSRGDNCINPNGSILPETTEHFYSKTRGRLFAICKVCVSARSLKYYYEHRQERLEYGKSHTQQKPSYSEWPEERKARKRKYRRAQYAKAPTKQLVYDRRYHSKHPAARRLKSHNRRLKHADVKRGFTNKEWARCLEYFGHKCAVCGREADLWTIMSIDHWVSINTGGSHTADNIVPLCHNRPGAPSGQLSCNCSKQDKPALEWLISKYGNRRAKAIERNIQKYFDWIKTLGEV